MLQLCSLEKIDVSGASFRKAIDLSDGGCCWSLLGCGRQRPHTHVHPAIIVSCLSEVAVAVGPGPCVCLKMPEEASAGCSCRTTMQAPASQRQCSCHFQIFPAQQFHRCRFHLLSAVIDKALTSTHIRSYWSWPASCTRASFKQATTVKYADVSTS